MQDVCERGNEGAAEAPLDGSVCNDTPKYGVL